jgi:hypothetical protein
MFDHKDFTENPGKYRLFCTAQVVRAPDSDPDLLGQTVGVEYLRTAWNGVTHREEPIYQIRTAGGWWGTLFANALGRFVL